VEAWQIFPIVGAFAEPTAEEMAKRAELVPKTLAKLRAGEPVNVVTWGDSVTVGGDASTVEKRFANLFITRLQERFPAAKITHENAGIGATATPGRLPALKKEVLDFHPDLVTIEFVNDMGLPDEVIPANYKSAFEQIRAIGAEVILITPHFTMAEMMGKAHPRGGETRHTVEVLREVAKEYHVGLADASLRWAHLDEEGLPYVALLDNGINHPDDRGHEMFVKELMTFFPK
jgi:lysophospholipase L1-like esterase